MNKLKHVIGEIHRRSLWQVLGIYVVASWVIWQVVGSMYEWVGLPDWVPPTALVLLLIGLPIVLATAVVQEGAPGLGGSGGGDEDPVGRTPGVLTAADELAGTGERVHSVPAGTAASGAGAAELAGDAPPASAPAGSHGSEPAPPGGIVGYFTWKRAITGGVLAFAALGLATTGFMGMRAFGIGPAATLMSSGELEAEQPLVVADFHGLTGDTMLATVVTEALRADLAQSPTIEVADRARIRETLGRMLRPADAELDPATAREVATRLGLKGVVEGEVGRAGAGYTLSARLVTADSARTLATFRETAPDSTALLDAIESLSRSMRERIGESLRSVRASQPLASVTTPSLPALRKWAEGLKEERRYGNRRRAIRLLREAVQLDPAFAVAWHNLAILHYNNDRRAPTLDAMREALEHEERLTDVQRHEARGMLAAITGELDTAMAEQREVIAQTGDSLGAFIGLSDIAWNKGDFAAAEEYARVAVRQPRSGWVAHWNLWVAQADQGKLEAARRTAERTVERFPDLGTGRVLLGLQAFIEREHDPLDTLSDGWRRARVDQLRGRLQEAGSRLDGWGAGAEDRARAADFWKAWARLMLLGDPNAADRLAGLLADTVRPEGMPERLVAEAGLALAMYGREADARAARAVYEDAVPPPVRWKDDVILHALDGFLALHDGQVDSALVALRAARASTPWPAPADAFLGRAYDMIEMPDSAIAAYTRYLETPWSYSGGVNSAVSDHVLLVPAHARLAILHEERGDREAAARHYARVVELWADADPELQPRVEAARRALERLTGEGTRE